MVIGTALGWGNMETIFLAVALAFLSGFALTALPFLRNGYTVKDAMRIALAADTASISIMEIVDNLLMLLFRAPWMHRSIPCIFGEVLLLRSRWPGLPPSRSIVGSSRAGAGTRWRIVTTEETV